MKSWFYCVVLLVFNGCQLSNGTDSGKASTQDIIRHLEDYNTNKALSILDSIPRSLTKQLIRAEYDYLHRGEVSDWLFSTLPSEYANKEEEVYFNYSYGDYLFRKSQPIDTLSFKYYLKAYSIAKEENQDKLIIETLKRINNYFKKYNLDLNQRNKSIRKYQEYQNELKGLTKDSSDVFWAHYYDIHLRMLQIFNEESSTSTLTTEDFQTALSLSPREPYFKGIVHQLEGIYYTLLLNDPINGTQSYHIAEKYYSESNVFPAKRALFGLRVNDAIADAKKQDYVSAISKFKENLRIIPSEKSYHFERQFTYEHLADIYSKANEIDSATYYKDIATKYQDSIKSELLVLGIHEIDTRLKVSGLQKLLDEFNRHKLIYGTVILITLLLTIYSIVRWLKVDKVNKILRIEKKQTHEELAKVKQLVIKDSITLKNKTKIRLDELVYIRADDHYLQLYTSNGKKEYVRGKIKEIIDQLPPNFKQCHRSYIVNYNMIRNTTHNRILLDNNQFIPLSRTFKNHF
ncbi:MAG: LytR/AlgR family response regulator transcription factor [Flavobacteriaceae bacterium]